VEKNTKGLLIGGSIMTGVIVTAIGVAAVVIGGHEKSSGKPGYQTSTPTVADVAKQPGEISIEPLQITMVRGPDGIIRGAAAVSALFQNFNPTTTKITGDSRLAYSSEDNCLGKTIAAGSRCNVTITLNEKLTNTNTDATIAPTLLIQGNSTTPGGDIRPVEGKASIVGGNPNAVPGAAGAPGAIGTAGNSILTSGQPAPGGIDPYGSPPAASTIQGAPGTNSSVDYSQAPVPIAQKTLSPREQFMLARRQAVFSGAQPQTPPAPSKPQGGWDELGINTSVSSNPQDMTRVVTMDRIITAALIRPYDSRASQQVVAQVDRNVYGGHGRSILIPRGSTLVGTAQGGGAERVAISWTQIIRPDGARFKLEATSGDAMGQAGVPGNVNQRLMKRYGSILLGTALNVGVAKAFGASESASGGLGGEAAKNNGAIISDIVRSDLQKITADIVERNKAIQPVITIPAGTRITVIPTMDLQLRPLRGPEVAAVSYPRAQNAGAPAPRYDVDPGGSPSGNGGGNGGGNGQGGSQGITFSSPPSQQPRRKNDFLPSANAPQTGSTPPWASN